MGATGRTRPLRALRRVALAPGFVLLVWVAQLAFAKLLAVPGRAAAGAAMGAWTWFDDGHRIRAMAELAADNPAVAAAITMGLATSAVLATAFSIFAAPAILTRLDGQRSPRWIAAAVGRDFLPMLAQTGYGLVFRAICMGLAAIPLKLLDAGGLPLALLLASFPILVLDRARAAVVLDDARPYHPMTFLRAIGILARRPLWWLSGALIEAAKLAIVLGAMYLVLSAGPSPASLWVARAAGFAAIVLGMWRVSLAVEGRGAEA